jgi:hypothetical protein
MLDKFKQFCKSYVAGRQSKFTTNLCSTVHNNGSPLTVTHAAIYGDLLKKFMWKSTKLCVNSDSPIRQ